MPSCIPSKGGIPFIFPLLLSVFTVILISITIDMPREFLEPGLLNASTTRGLYSAFLERLYSPTDTTVPARLSPSQYADFVEEQLVLPKHSKEFDNFRKKYFPSTIATEVRGVVWSELTHDIPSFVWDDMMSGNNDDRYPLSTTSNDYVPDEQAINDQKLNELMEITDDADKLYRMLKIGRRVYKFEEIDVGEDVIGYNELSRINGKTTQDIKNLMTKKADNTWVVTSDSNDDDETGYEDFMEKLEKFNVSGTAYLLSGNVPGNLADKTVAGMQADTTYQYYVTDQELRQHVNCTRLVLDNRLPYYVKGVDKWYKFTNEEQKFVLPKVVFKNAYENEAVTFCKDASLDDDEMKTCSKYHRAVSLLPPSSSNKFPALCLNSETKDDETAHTLYSPIAAYHVHIYERILATHGLTEIRNDLTILPDDDIDLEIASAKTKDNIVSIKVEDLKAPANNRLSLLALFKKLNSEQKRQLLSESYHLELDSKNYEIKCLVNKPLFDDKLKECKDKFWGIGRSFYVLYDEDSNIAPGIVALIISIAAFVVCSIRIYVLPVDEQIVMFPVWKAPENWKSQGRKTAFAVLMQTCNYLLALFFLAVFVTSVWTLVNLGCLAPDFGIGDYATGYLNAQLGLLWVIMILGLVVFFQYFIDVISMVQGKAVIPAWVKPSGQHIYAEVVPTHIMP